MGLFIGNLSKDKLPASVISNFEDSKIYGVSFEGDGSYGVPLYDAVGLVWEPSTESKAGRDDFTMDDNGNSPFHVKKCIRIWDSSSGTAEYIFEEDDPTRYNSSKTLGDHMIAFPKFYYKRPNQWTFLVSSDPIPGFTISPMHYKATAIGGIPVEYDYVYIGEYMADTNYNSRPGSSSKPVVSQPIDTFRSKFKAKGAYVLDLSCRMMINMLCAIKMRCLDVQEVNGLGWTETVTGKTSETLKQSGAMYDVIKGLDGYQKSLTATGHVRTMGLQDFYANCWEFVDGLFAVNQELYINNDIATIDAYPSMSDYPARGWTKMDFKIGVPSYSGTTVYATWINELTYNQDYSWIMGPSGTPIRGETTSFATGQKTPPTNSKVKDIYWGVLPTDTTPRCLIFGGAWVYGSAAGLWFWYSNSTLSNSNAGISARQMSF